MTAIHQLQTVFIFCCLVSAASAQGLASGDHFPNRIEQVGETLVSTGQDMTLRWWDLKDGSEIRRLKVSPVIDLAGSNNVHVSDRCGTFATAHKNGEIVFWTPNGKQLGTIKHDGVQSICFFTDRSKQDETLLRLASGGKDKTLRIWDVSTGQLVESIELETDLLNITVSNYDAGNVESGPYKPVAAIVQIHPLYYSKRSLQFIELHTQKKSVPFDTYDPYTRKRTIQFVDAREFSYLQFNRIVNEVVRPMDTNFEMDREKRKQYAQERSNPFFEKIWCFQQGEDEVVAVGGPFFAAILHDGKVVNMRRIKGYAVDIRFLKPTFKGPLRIAIAYGNNIDIWTPSDFSREKSLVPNEQVIHIVPEHE